jgi:Arc/MetJ-type ribon-helix-helix transcriptional regulator
MRITFFRMKTVTVRLPETVVAEIEAESRRRRMSKSDVVRERLAARPNAERKMPPLLEAIQDLIGSVDGPSGDISVNKKAKLKEIIHARKRRR